MEPTEPRRVFLMTLLPSSLGEIAGQLNARQSKESVKYEHVTLLDSAPSQQQPLAAAELRKLVLGYRVDNWKELSCFFQRNRTSVWIWIIDGKAQQENGKCQSYLQLNKNVQYYTDVLSEVWRLFKLPLVRCVGDTEKQRCASIESILSEPTETIVWQDAQHLEQEASRRAYDLLSMAHITEQGSSPNRQCKEQLLVGLAKMEVFRRNGLDANCFQSRSAKLPIVVDIRQPSKDALLSHIKTKMRKDEVFPSIRYFLQGEQLQRIERQQVAECVDVQLLEKQLLTVWCSYYYYSRASGVPFGIRAIICEDNTICQIPSGEHLILGQGLLEYMRNNPFQASESRQWETYPYKEVAERLVLLNETSRSLNGDIFDTLQEISQHRSGYKELLCHIVYDGNQVLVKRSNGMEPSQSTLEDTLDRVSLFDDIIVSDVSKEDMRIANRKLIQRIAKNYYIYTQGAVSTVEDVQDLLSHSIRKIVLQYPADLELARKAPDTRYSIGVTLANNMVEANGKSIPLEQVVTELTERGLLHSVYVTTRETLTSEREVLDLARNIMLKLHAFSRVYLDCGVSTLAMVRCLWRFDKLVPVVGGQHLQNAQLMSEVLSDSPIYDRKGVVTCTVLGTNGIIQGYGEVSRQAIRKTCLTRKLHFCRSNSQQVYMKEYEHTVRKISMACNSRSVLFVCESATNANFCQHLNRVSCYRNQSIVKTNLSVINGHIKGKINSKSYSGVMQSNPGLALAKVMEEFWEIICASNNEEQTNQCSDFLVHFLMYINGKGVALEDIINELNARAYAPQLVPKFSKTNLRDPSVVSLGILNEKYFKSTDKFIEEELGIRIVRPTVPRKLLIECQISDQEKYDKFFKGKRVSFLPLKSKDMPWMIAFGAIDGCITYTPVMDNNPNVSVCLHRRQVMGLRISLIKRKNDVIDPNSWSRNNKAIIACEHVNYVHQYFIEQGIDQSSFTLSRIVGSSESYLITKTNVHFCLCDAVVETGLTLTANDLEEWRVIKKDGDISIGLFMSLKYKP